MYYRLPELSLVSFTGADAVRVLNNLCTADLAKLELNQGVETFVCDVRGRTVGHGLLFRHEDQLRFVGAPGQTERVAAHADRYIIREDCQPQTVDTDWTGVWLAATAADQHDEWSLEIPLAPWLGSTTSADMGRYQVPWTHPNDRLLLVAAEQGDALEERLRELGHAPIDATTFHRLRIRHRFPWYGVDLDETNLPQEADRDAAAISFTKGCYLGQETVARLDALGQVQKKLVRWALASTDPPAAGTEVRADDRVVGKITSAVPGEPPEEPGVIALGFARRSHFEPGSVADCEGVAATVMD